jgi:steroid 5-alpha reductase family enzyme
MVGLWSALALFVLATAGWAVSIVRRNANVVDELWGVAQLVLAAVCLIAGEQRTARSWLTAALVATWGLRLTIHLSVRGRRRGEDWRHAEARRRHERFAVRSLFEIFWFQLVGGALVVGLPLFAVVTDGQPSLGWLDALAVAVWVIGFLVEASADAQLARFRAAPHAPDVVLDTGLWRYSRHPNYFGDFVQWVGVALLGVAAGHLWSLLSPLMMLVILLRISGVAAMDAHLRTSRGEAYARYVQTTSAFLPLPTRRERAPSG